MKKSITWIIIIIILVVLGIILISVPKQKAPETAVPEPEEAEELLPGEEGTAIEGISVKKIEKEMPLFEDEIKLEIHTDGFRPNEFRVTKDQSLINFSLLNMDPDSSYHLLRFDDPFFKGMTIPAQSPGGEVQKSTFMIPEKQGDYTFFDFANSELTGIMHVE
ncbi:hypothetical protein MYX06_03470 [Patescibacteria group bacterium AH-259-L05]|nr:hypothetical protein [Patescibacteria group bacterium AH-259-L05]